MTYKEKTINVFKGLINKTELGYIKLNINELKEYINIPVTYSNARIVERIIKPSLMELRTIINIYKINYEKSRYNKVENIKICFIKDKKYSEILKENIKLIKPKKKDLHKKEEIKYSVKKLVKTKKIEPIKKVEIEKISLLDIAKENSIKKFKELNLGKKIFRKIQKDISKLKTIEEVENYKNK